MASNIALNAAKECFQPMDNARIIAQLEVSPIYRRRFAKNALQPVPLAIIFMLIIVFPAKIAA
jgi:hypothetical protein